MYLPKLSHLHACVHVMDCYLQGCMAKRRGEDVLVKEPAPSGVQVGAVRRKPTAGQLERPLVG